MPALRWLDLHGLCTTLLHSGFGPGHTLQGVYYFSALARHLEHRDPDVVRRHRTYAAALEATGVMTSFAQFKRRERDLAFTPLRVRVGGRRWPWKVSLPWLQFRMRMWEEKETDVAIACKVLELLHRQETDGIVLVTGDTDLIPAVRTVQRTFPSAEVRVAFPYRRYNEGFAQVVKNRFKLDTAMYSRHLLPNPLTTQSGRVLTKPERW